MATPTNDTYSAPSGETLYAGRTMPLPDWLPAAGTIADVTTNTINDVKGGDSFTESIFVAWSGCAWAPWWGEYGSLIFSGGGHGDGDENTVYRCDLATQLVSKIKSKATTFYYDDGGGSYCADQTTGWLWANTSGSAVQAGEPFASHFYSYLIALPEAAMPGEGATNGWLYMPGHRSMPAPGQRGTDQACKLRIGIDTTYTHQGTNTGFGPGNGLAIYDALRKRVWTVQNGPTASFDYRDLDNDSHGSLTVSPGSMSGYYCIGGYHVAEDLLMYARMDAGSLQFRVVDPATGTSYTPSTSGTAPTSSDGAWDWSNTWNAWAYYKGDGGNTVFFLKAPSNPRTGTWVWSSQTFTGTARANGSNPPYNRLRHAHTLGKTLLWAPLYNQPVQAIHLSAAP